MLPSFPSCQLLSSSTSRTADKETRGLPVSPSLWVMGERQVHLRDPSSVGFADPVAFTCGD